MKVDLKQQKYIIPLLILPFLFLGFYLYKDTFEEEVVVVVGEYGLQENITEVSDEIKNRDLKDKLRAYQDTYRQADGYTAISGFGQDEDTLPGYDDLYSDQEKARLDSLDEEYKRAAQSSAKAQVGGYQPRSSNMGEQDRALLGLLSQSAHEPPQRREEKEHDPLELMKAQYALIDSLQKANDPEYRTELQRQEIEEARQAERERRRLGKITVLRADKTHEAFNTLKPEAESGFIKAIIDEGITGYAGSRIRIRLLEDIRIGEHRIPAGTYLYALINGFSDQRVTLIVNSVTVNGQRLPINLNVFDMDGLEGLYVPESAFREFTKDLGASTMQGTNITQNPQGQSEFLMSGLQRMFTSTSQAIANAIRMNKAKIKYSTHIYLIDAEELNNYNQEPK